MESILIQLDGKSFKQLLDEILEAKLKKHLPQKSEEEQLKDQYDAYIPAKEAAKLLHYAPNTLTKKYDHQTPGLAPIQRGRDKFYKKEEVFKLRRLIFRDLESQAISKRKK